LLVIRRRAGESILIAGDIEIEVLETSPTRVKLGIRAPKDVDVVRKEIGLIAGENLCAARDIPLELLTPVLALLDARPAPSQAAGTPAHSRLPRPS
jgi:carbon storage regulator